MDPRWARDSSRASPSRWRREVLVGGLVFVVRTLQAISQFFEVKGEPKYDGCSVVSVHHRGGNGLWRTSVDVVRET